MANKKVFRELSESDLQIWLEASKDVKKLKCIKPKVSIQPKKKVITNVIERPIVRVPSVKTSAINMGDLNDLSKKVARQMNKGQIYIDARIDLHGYTEMVAFSKLIEFIELAYSQQHRLVLVITGKGNSTKPSVIKSRLPHWINTERISPFIIRFTQASSIHGGMGAFYIYLRKPK